MNVRIENGRIGGMESAEAKRAEQTPAPVAPLAAGVGRQPAEDRVEISAISEAITASGDASNPGQAERVKALSAIYDSGKYHVDSAKLASAIVTASLESGGTKDPQ